MQQQNDLGDADSEHMGLGSDSDSDSDDDEGPSLRERRQRWRAWDEEHQRSRSGNAGGINEDGKRKKRRAEQPGTRQPRRDGARGGYGSQHVRLDTKHALTSYKSTAARVTFCRHGAWSLLAVRGETCSTT